MEYIVFGAGDDGKHAFACLGERVGCFCDNRMAGREVNGKSVLSFADMLTRYNLGKSIIVIASSKYQIEMEWQLRENNIERFFVFNHQAWENYKWSYWPKYWLYCHQETMSYTEVLMRNEIEKYKHIAVSNINVALPYLLAEIAFQCDEWRVCFILSEKVSDDMKFMGVSVIGVDALYEKNIDCLIINEQRNVTSIRDDLEGKLTCCCIDMFDISKFIPAFQHPELKKYKKIHNGARCFVIGNGPSLRMKDLDKLYENNEVCFGVNKIYKAFPYTKWRPTYHCISDINVMRMYDDNVDKESSHVIYADTYHWSNFQKSTKVDYLHMVGEEYGENMPGFSFDITECVYNGCTVTYDMCLQMAVYMGFKEIYLLGTDCSSPNGLTSKDSHFVPDYCSKEEQDLLVDFDFEASWKRIMRAYRKSELVSRTHGFRIYNATRGGKLEEFERVNFDSLF